MLVCFLGSLVSHCPVFPPWLRAHWPLFGDILPQEPSLALPSPSPRQLLQTHSGERTQTLPSHLESPPPNRGPFLWHPFSRCVSLSTDCVSDTGLGDGRDQSLCSGDPPVGEERHPRCDRALAVGSPYSLGSLCPLSQVLRVEEESPGRKGGGEALWTEGRACAGVWR